MADDIRRALIQRVASQVEGRGIQRNAVAAAVDEVLAVLAARGELQQGGEAAALRSGDPVIVAFASRSSPDLASRVRAAFTHSGAGDIPLGRAGSGAHTVVTARIPSGMRQLAERIGGELGVTVTIHSADTGGSPGQVRA